jgi:WD40-like Beta Propeller Repeat
VNVRELLLETPVPDVREAEDRAWRVVNAAFEQRAPAPRPRPRRNRLVIAIAIAALALILVLTPAGAKVADLVHDVVHPGERNARPLTSLPAPGRLLVESAQGPWVVNEDGSKRLLGDYRAATWSPRGLFVAVTAGHELSAVEPGGTVHWTRTLPRPVSDPRWAPSGIRIAYRMGSSMRVVAGDNTVGSDHLVAAHVAPTPPAWRPFLPEAKVEPVGTNVLAFAEPDGRISVVHANGDVIWRSDPGPVPSELDWSADGSLLVAVSGRSLRVFAGDGSLLGTRRLPSGIVARAGAFAPTGQRFAIAGTSSKGGRSRGAVVVLRPGSPGSKAQPLFPGPGRFTGLSWSPNGQWLLVAWPSADEWLFLNQARPGQIKTAGDISAQFNPGATSSSAFPRLAGWTAGD